MLTISVFTKMDEHEILKVLMDFRASAAEWELTEFKITQGIKELIKTNLERDDRILALQHLLMMRKFKQ